MKTELPFPTDPAFDYILTESDRKKFAPKLATDEFWYCYDKAGSGCWKPYGDKGGDGCFYADCFYRRRKSPGLTTSELRDAVIASLNAISSKEGFKTVEDFYLDEDKVLARMVDWQPPRPAAEVAFESLWPELLKDGALTKESMYQIFKVGWDACENHKEGKSK